MDISKYTLISLWTKLDRTNPKGIHIGYGTSVAFGTTILSHDGNRNLHVDTRIGKFCSIGANVTIFAGVNIGDHCVIGTGSVVIKNVEARTTVLGNPARVIRRNVHTKLWGILCDEDEDQKAEQNEKNLTDNYW